MSVKLGELYYELGIEDQTKQALADSGRRIGKWEDDNGQVTVEVDAKWTKAKKALDEARAAVEKADGSKAVYNLTADGMEVTTELAQAERKLEEAERKYERTKLKLQVDDSGLPRSFDRAGGLLDDFRQQGEAPIRPSLDLGPIDRDANEGKQSLVDMIRGWETAAIAAAAIVGGAIGKALVDQFSEFIDREALGDKLAAQLGLAPDDAARLASAGAAVYAANWGESIGQVNDAIRAAMVNGLIDEQSTNAEIESVTTKLLLLSDVFDGDLSMAAQGVGQLIRTGLVADASEGFDLVVASMQRGVNKSDDLLESLQEYSTQFRELGVNGRMGMGLVLQGLEAGARDGDTVVDTLKELAIRSKDASSTSAQGYELLGLNADKYTRMAANGGAEATQALDDVLDALRRMDDPVKQNTAAVALFGTKAEDLGDALYSIDPSTAVSALGEVAGAADRAGQTVGDNLAGKWESWKRTAETGVQDYLGSLVAAYDEGGFDGIADKLGEDIDRLGDLWDEHGPVILAAVSAWWNEQGEPLVEEAAKVAVGAAWDGVLAYLKEKITDPQWWWDMLTTGMVKPVVDFFAEKGVDLAHAATDWIGQIPTLVRDLAAGVWNPLSDGFEFVINAIIDRWNSLSFDIPSVSVFGHEIGGGSIGVPQIGHVDIPSMSTGGGGNAFGDLGSQIPRFAKGGFVDAPVGKAVLAVLHGGEYVNTAADVSQGRTGAPGPRKGAGRRSHGFRDLHVHTGGNPTTRAVAGAVDRSIMGWAG